MSNLGELMMGFTLIDNDTMVENMSDGAFRLYCVLQSYCFGEKDICFPSQKTLGEKLRRSVRTIQRYIKELVEAKLIQVIRRGANNNNYYKLVRKAAQKSIRNTLSIIKAAADKHKSSQNSNKGYFNNYQQRNYNMEKLEKLLLHGDSSLSYEDCLL